MCTSTAQGQKLLSLFNIRTKIHLSTSLGTILLQVLWQSQMSNPHFFHEKDMFYKIT